MLGLRLMLPPEPEIPEAFCSALTEHSGDHSKEEK